MKRTTPVLIAIVATAALALPLAASAAASSETTQLVAFSRCMRAHGVHDFPDPQPAAAVTKFPSAKELGVSGSVYNAAVSSCQRLLPAGTDDEFPRAEVRVLLIGMLRFSNCVRHHGVPNWPDPSTYEGRPVFNLGSAGISRSEFHSPAVTRAVTYCNRLLPSALGGIPVGGA